jgi:hypothetical protein
VNEALMKVRLQPVCYRIVPAFLILLMGGLSTAQVSFAGVAGDGPHPLTYRAVILYGSPADGTFPNAAPGELVLPDTLFKVRPVDPWLAFDKVQHVTFSFLFTLGSQYALVNKADLSERNALPLSIGISASVGLAKELYDWQLGPRRYFSPRDMIGNAVGIVFAVGVIAL